MDVSRFKQRPILGILRGADPQTIIPIVEAAIAGGLETLEITMNTPNAPRLIRSAVETSAGRLMIGAGTVLDKGDLDAAVDAGATFIVMPTLVREVVEQCVADSIPVFPGALTPHEIHQAWKAGATMVKVFPASVFGPSYFREIKGPFGDIELLACGGVGTANVAEYFASGASAVAFGGSIFKKAWLQNGHYSEIRDSIRTLIEAYNP